MPVSLMAPTVAPSQGVTNRLNGFESNLSTISQAGFEARKLGAQSQEILKQAMQMRVAAHNAANEALVTDYTNRLHKETADIFNQLKTKTNKAAIDARPEVMEALQQAQSRFTEELKDKDPYVVNKFKEAAQTALFDAQTKADAYIMEQSIKYRDTERAAQIANLVESYASNIENSVMAQKYKAELDAARAQQNDELGIVNGSESDKAAYKALLSPVSQSQVDKYIGLKQFNAARDALHGFFSAGEITSDAYNDSLVKLVRSEESARRQAEADYMRRVRFANSQKLAAERLKTEGLRQQKYIYDAQKRYFEDQYGDMSKAEENALYFNIYDKLKKDPNAFTTYTDENGQVQQYTSEQRDLLLRQATDSTVRKIKLDRNMASTVEKSNYDLLAVLERHGSGDSPSERVKNAYSKLQSGQSIEGVPYESMRSAVEWWQETGKSEGELDAMAQLLQSSRIPDATALTLEHVKRMAARGDIPLDSQGNADLVQLGLTLKNQGFENYDFSKINAAAGQYAKSKMTASDQQFNSSDLANEREWLLMSTAATQFEAIEDQYDDLSDYISFDPSDSSGANKAKYNVGKGVIARVALELENEASAISFDSVQDKQRWFIMRAAQSDVQARFRHYIEEALYYRNGMTIEQANSFDDRRNAEALERWNSGE